MFVALPIAYSLFLLLVETVLGLNYIQIAASTLNMLRWIVIPLSVAGVFLVVLTRRFGLWGRAIRDEVRAGGWALTIPILLLAVELMAIPYGVFGRLGATYVLTAAISVAIVGFNEELIFRGVLLIGLRERTTERWAFLWSTLAFGAAHGVNFLTGLPWWVTLLQMCTAFLTGSVLYMARRATGSIAASMALHALWDFWAFMIQGAVFAGLLSQASQSVAPLAAVGVMIVLAAVTIVAVLSGAVPGPATVSEGATADDVAPHGRESDQPGPEGPAAGGDSDE